MTNKELQRSIRRATAILLIPLSILVIQFSIHLRKTAGLVDSGAVTTAELAGYAIIVASSLYLAVSAVAGVYAFFEEQ